jgi:hypothetical protein
MTFPGDLLVEVEAVRSHPADPLLGHLLESLEKKKKKKSGEKSSVEWE